MKKKLAFIWIVILLIMISGCAEQFKKFSQKITEHRKENMLQSYLQAGKEYEDTGKLAEAYKQYKLAITVSPENREAARGIDRLEKELRKWAEKYYREGMKFHNQGKYHLARRKFLTALKFWPDHPRALKMLTPRKHVKYKKHIEHIVKPGESLSKIAMIYYGDYRKFGIIAEYNNIPDATLTHVGQKIIVPAIEGVPFLTEKQAIKTEEIKIPDSAVLDQEIKKAEKEEKEEPVDKKVKEELEKPVDEEVKEEVEEPVDEMKIYRSQGVEFFNKMKYREAIAEFNKVMNVNPDDATAIEYLARSHFQCAVDLFEKRNYLKAIKEFEVSLQYNKSCQTCLEYIKKSENTYMEIHYKRGIAHFAKEQLVEAIMEWKLVQAIDSNYKDVANNFKTAKILLKRLEEIKKSQEAK
ncbi:MAG: LysM peptidoglycan-binding domain-containing protein [Deltaproteobacteria bacterium]|nr:LysM peptidoglycan-binding domain-containing protein [Deltaproteobacteria bacterium]